MTIWKGIALIGCPRGSAKKSPVVQGVVYTVKQINENDVVLRMLKDYRPPETDKPKEEDEEEDEDDECAKPSDITLLLEDVPTLMRLTHAMCYYTVQGRTLRDHTLLLDTSHNNFSRRALIVGLSRADHGDLVHVATDEEEAQFMGGRRWVARRVVTQ